MKRVIRRGGLILGFVICGVKLASRDFDVRVKSRVLPPAVLVWSAASRLVA